MNAIIRRCGSLLFMSIALVACSDLPTSNGSPHELPGDPVLGQIAFKAECASCHATGDGFDLALFSFFDSTIVRRALGHVDMDTALDIVAHIRSINVPQTLGEVSSPFQPAGILLGSDFGFAMDLFGMDMWPAALTTADLRRMDVWRTEVAVEFPVWSIEENNLDWMPDVPVPDHLLDYRNGRARNALDDLYREGSVQSLIAAVDALSDGDSDKRNAFAPCIMDPISDLRARECFEARRWAASLGAQFMLRYGLNGPVHRDIHDVWWDVGNVARRSVTSRAVRGEIENGVENWVSWMWMGWAFEPSRHASIYLSLGLERKGMLRHATFHILKAQVERSPSSSSVYRDLRNVSRFAPDTWLMNAMTFGYTHILERLRDGERVTGDENLEMAIYETQRAYRDAAKRLSASQSAVLVGLRDEVLEYLQY